MVNSDDNQGSGHKSVIKKIMVEQEEKARTSADPLVVVMNALNVLKEREREVLISRFGLTGDKKATLETIGRKLRVTRERVRQIETTAIKRLANSQSKELTQLIKIINSYITGNGGLTDLKGLAEYLKVDSDQRAEATTNALRLAMAVNGAVLPLEKRAGLKPGWAQKQFPIDLLVPIINEVEKILDEANQVMSDSVIWDKFQETDLYAKNSDRITSLTVNGAIHVAINITQTRDGKWGLSSWPTVVPKRIRDKVYLILKRKNEPMHFTDITEAVNREYPDKQVLSRTVHNELIGDDRFVLVGRGIYALKSWGYKPGVVADVIQDILKKAKRPMTTSEIIEAVLQIRQIKRNTVIANLQNHKLFKKVGRGTYTLA
ncbi:hypothetical protein DRH29_00185 [candidate division Kazan bacterium]|uniref:HTH HARE-type domain-containing protein n=1 Tax=candidate division Kazan bacterium TaxID=2202143 RepID=A0A420ZDT4_UNCK3|nr:MAG: hypothetical protein DRH29_00185 [candidate division Kazan bacterium]